MNNAQNRCSPWLVLLPLACACWAIALLWWGIVWRIALHTEEILLVWHGRPLPIVRWPLAAFTILFSALGFFLIRRAHPASCSSGEPGIRGGGWAWRLTPLVWSPLSVLPALFADGLSRHLVSNGLFFGWTLILASIGARLYASGRAPRFLIGRSGKAIVAGALFVLGAGAYGFGGHHFSSHAGEHLGDEGHYLIQTKSLHEHGDLDLRRYVLDEHGKKRAGLSHFHIARTSRPPNMYSWHPMGLPLLATPLWPWGMAARHLLLGLIAGAGLAGLFLLAMESGAGLRASLAVTLALGLSAYWTLFAFRFLPETLGATLMIWSFQGIALQRRRPWTAVFIAVLMNGYLPFAHTRFLPLSLMAFGFFGLMGLFGGTPETWPRRLVRLTVFSLLSLGTYGVYAYAQFRLFVGGSSYPIDSTLFSYWPGAWEVFADARGAAPLLPLLYWMVPAALVWPWKDRSQPLLSLGLLLTFAACVVTSCTNHVSVGGSCVQGRYLLVVIPLLAPGAAWCLRRVGSREILLFMILSVISILPIFFLLYWLPFIGRNFTEPFLTIGAQPLFNGIFSPYIGLRSVHWPIAVFRSAALFPLVALAGVLILLSWSRRLGRLLLGVSLAAALFAHVATQPPARAVEPGEMSALLNRLHVRAIRLARKPDDAERNFFEVFRGEFRDFHRHGKLVLTSTDIPEAEPPLYRYRDIALNDWEGRPFRWFTLTAPFPPDKGTWIVHVAGTISGKARPHFAVREGAHLRVEMDVPVDQGRWQINQHFDLQGRKGDLYLLLRIEGRGGWTCEITRLGWSRYNPHMPTDAALVFGTDFKQEALSDDASDLNSMEDENLSWAMPDED